MNVWRPLSVRLYICSLNLIPFTQCFRKCLLQVHPNTFSGILRCHEKKIKLTGLEHFLVDELLKAQLYLITPTTLSYFIPYVKKRLLKLQFWKMKKNFEVFHLILWLTFQKKSSNPYVELWRTLFKLTTILTL